MAGEFVTPDGAGAIGITPTDPQVRVPNDYISGAPIRAVREIENATFASLLLAPGVYEYALPNDIIRIYVGEPLPPPHFVDDELLACESDLDAANADIFDGQSQLDAANAVILGLQSDLNAANAEILGLQSGLNAANAVTLGLQSDLSAANAVILGLQSDLNAANAELAQLQAALAEANAQLASRDEVIANTEQGLAAVLELVNQPFGHRIDPRLLSGPFNNATLNEILDALLAPSGQRTKKKGK